jgi:DNA-binding MarR family transcriptional regulator
MPEPAGEPPLGVLLFIPVRHMEERILAAVVAAGFPITMAQAKLAQRIDPGGSRLGRLADAAQVTKQSAGYLVDQLEEAGYVERVPDPRDARAVLVRIAERGRRAIAVAQVEESRIEEEWERHVGTEALESLRATLLGLREITDPYA